MKSKWLVISYESSGNYISQLNSTVGTLGGYIYFITVVEWLHDVREQFENEMRRIQKEGKWRWVLMKESPDEYIEGDHALIYAFKILQ